MVVCCEDVLTGVSDGSCRSAESAQPRLTEGKRWGPSADITCTGGAVKGRREEERAISGTSNSSCEATAPGGVLAGWWRQEGLWEGE